MGPAPFRPPPPIGLKKKPTFAEIVKKRKNQKKVVDAMKAMKATKGTSAKQLAKFMTQEGKMKPSQAKKAIKKQTKQGNRAGGMMSDAELAAAIKRLNKEFPIADMHKYNRKKKL